MRVIFSDRAYLAILAETSEKIATETGGIFLGCFENGIFYVVEAIDPGPKAIFQVAYFEYDQQYTQHLINKTARLYNHELSLVGLWHRHPGSFDRFSPTDDGTNRQYAKMSEYGAVSALINIDPDFRITTYHVANPLKYLKISHEVGDSLIPEHIKAPKDIKSLQNHISGHEKKRIGLKTAMDSIKSHFVEAYDVKKPSVDEPIDTDTLCPHEYLIESLIDDISYLSEERGIELTVQQDKNENVVFLLEKDSMIKIRFNYIDSLKKVLFSYDECLYVYDSGLFSKLLKNNTGESEDIKKGTSLKNNIIRMFNPFNPNKS